MCLYKTINYQKRDKFKRNKIKGSLTIHFKGLRGMIRSNRPLWNKYSTLVNFKGLSYTMFV